MNTYKLNKQPNDNPYIEISQYKDCKFAWLSQDSSTEFTELFSPVKCKDYLEDLLIACKTGNLLEDTIYGFCYPHHVDVSSHIYTSVTLGNTTDKQRVIDSFHMISEYEPLDKTEISLVEDSDTTIIIKTPQFWLRSPLLYSIYTFLIRSLAYNEGSYSDHLSLFRDISNSNGNDSTYVCLWLDNCDLDLFMSNVDFILGENVLTGCSDKHICKEMFEDTNYKNEENFSMYTLHDRIGLHSFSKGVSEVLNNHEYSSAVGKQWVLNYINLKEAL